MCLGWFFDFDEKSGFGSPDFYFLRIFTWIDRNFFLRQLIPCKNPYGRFFRKIIGRDTIFHEGIVFRIGIRRCCS